MSGEFNRPMDDANRQSDWLADALLRTGLRYGKTLAKLVEQGDWR
jgi:hypothetical protein